MATLHALVSIVAALGLYGSCEECEPCVKHCGTKCLRKVFQQERLSYDQPSAVEECCMEHGNRTGKTSDWDCYAEGRISESSLPSECRERHPAWRHALQYWQCRRRCDAAFGDSLGNMNEECCYETAVKACGDAFAFSGHHLLDHQEKLMEECKRLTFVHAGCPGGGAMYDFNVSSLEVVVKWSWNRIYSSEYEYSHEYN